MLLDQSKLENYLEYFYMAYSDTSASFCDDVSQVLWSRDNFKHAKKINRKLLKI